jgi:glutathione S-transferase
VKLYYSPGACSLACHIALHEAGFDFELLKVDLKRKTLDSGADYTAVSPKGYVPALVLDSGEVLTENLAVLDWIATQSPALGLDGPLGRTRLLEALAFISTEVHKSYKPFFAGGSDDDRAKARTLIEKRLQLLADRAIGPYLFGKRLSAADCYLFVMLLWAGRFGVAVPERLLSLRSAMLERRAVQHALMHEGLNP